MLSLVLCSVGGYTAVEIEQPRWMLLLIGLFRDAERRLRANHVLVLSFDNSKVDSAGRGLI